MFEYYTIPRTTENDTHRARSMRAAEEYEFNRALRELNEKRRAQRRANRKSRRTRRLPRLAPKWLA